MTQEKAELIIRSYYGTDTIVLGISTDMIFWIYDDEMEEDYKTFEI